MRFEHYTSGSRDCRDFAPMGLFSERCHRQHYCRIGLRRHQAGKHCDGMLMNDPLYDNAGGDGGDWTKTNSIPPGSVDPGLV